MTAKMWIKNRWPQSYAWNINSWNINLLDFPRRDWIIVLQTRPLLIICPVGGRTAQKAWANAKWNQEKNRDVSGIAGN